MDSSDPLYEYVRRLMLEIMTVLWANGHTQVHVGAMMRLLGVPEESAAQHDDERIDLDETFAEIAADVNVRYLMQTQVPAGTTVH